MGKSLKDVLKMCKDNDVRMIDFKLTDEGGLPIPEEKLYKPYFGPKCESCGTRLTCNGCSRCGRCENAGALSLPVEKS